MRTRYSDDMEYWTGIQLFAHSYADVYICMSIRNLGKSYACMKLIRKSVRKGYSAVCSRWDAGELSIIRDEFFRDPSVLIEYEEHAIKNTSGYYYIHKKTGARIYFIPVKEAHKFKGLDIPNLKYWFYDEFIPEFYPVKTRKTLEFKLWASMYTTLRRNNQGFKAILCANCLSWFNGYYDAWSIRPFPQGYIRRFKQSVKLDDQEISMWVVMESVKPTKAMLKRVVADEVLKGKSRSEIDDYLANSTYDRTTFIGKCPDPTVNLANMQWKYDGSWYGFREYQGIFYWEPQKSRRAGIPAYAMSVQDLEEKMRLPKEMCQWLETSYMSGGMRFDTGFTESAILSGIYAMRLRL